MNYVTSILAALFVFIGTAQELPNLIAPNKITTITYWTKGEKKTYTKTTKSIRYKENSDVIAQEKTATELIELKVVDSAEHYYIIEARYGEVKSDAQNTELNELTKDLKLNIAVRYRIDEFGSFDTILNLPELKKELLASVEQLKKNYAIRHTPEEAKTFNLVMGNFSKLYADQDNVQDLFATDIVNIHGYYGTELTVGQPEEFELSYPMLGDIYLSGKGTLTLGSISKSADLATINVTSKPDKEELNAAVKELMQSFFAGTPAENDKIDGSISSSSKEKIQMRLSDGWIEKLEMTQTNTITVSGKKTKVVNTIIYSL